MTKLAAGAATLALAALPGAATAQQQAVDEETGPVAYANAAALKVGEKGGSVISETQRSPLSPGTSRLAQSRTTVPGTDDERAAAGPYYEIGLGKHHVAATLKDTNVPTAVARADYALRDLARKNDPTVLEFQGAKSEVTCPAPGSLTGTTSAEKLWVRHGGKLVSVKLPSGNEPLTLRDLPLGPPRDVPDAAAGERVTSDVTISRISSYDDLLRQEQWRSGDVTVAAGWQVEIVTHVPKAVKPTKVTDAPESPEAKSDDTAAPETSGTTETSETTGAGEESGTASTGRTDPATEQTKHTEHTEDTGDVEDVVTRIVLGGVSCSLPQDFVAAAGGDGRSGPAVPVKIPAGDGPGQAATPWGAGLLGAGVLFGGAAVLVARRRRPGPGAE
ncbi:hypothetical protein [Qaidamihabitans albus]|uniref:hypothetical protein n=1 Tax=Qaidamihabitans albus TaxID=2795733 RepID=UPI0018F116BA|nr:hypothetical protein [Qaidamihabitans albus]